MNTVILTSVLSAGNHALFAGTRVLYGALPFTSALHLPENQRTTGLSVTTPRQAPKLLSWTNSAGTPIPALLATSSISALCFASSFIGSGELWGWLQNIVGVSTQVLFPKPFSTENLPLFLPDCVALDWSFKLAFSPGLDKAGKTPR